MTRASPEKCTAPYSVVTWEDRPPFSVSVGGAFSRLDDEPYGHLSDARRQAIAFLERYGRSVGVKVVDAGGRDVEVLREPLGESLVERWRYRRDPDVPDDFVEFLDELRQLDWKREPSCRLCLREFLRKFYDAVPSAPRLAVPDWRIPAEVGWRKDAGSSWNRLCAEYATRPDPHGSSLYYRGDDVLPESVALRRIRHFVRYLRNERMRDIWELRHNDGWTYKRIGARFGISVERCRQIAEQVPRRAWNERQKLLYVIAQRRRGSSKSMGYLAAAAGEFVNAL